MATSPHRAEEDEAAPPAKRARTDGEGEAAPAEEGAAPAPAPAAAAEAAAPRQSKKISAQKFHFVKVGPVCVCGGGAEGGIF